MGLLKRVRDALSRPEVIVENSTESNEDASMRELGTLCLSSIMLPHFRQGLEEVPVDAAANDTESLRAHVRSIMQ